MSRKAGVNQRGNFVARCVVWHEQTVGNRWRMKEID